jgi:short-subunit dehydrogenase
MTQIADQALFAKQYGPWAVITGASDGTGASFARHLANLGLNLVLIARREGPLKQLSQALGEDFGIEVRPVFIDLYEAGAGQRVVQAAEGLDVGLFISNAGSDPNGSAFMGAPLSAWKNMLERNVSALVEPCYGFAEQMLKRGRGGIIVMSSGAALGGQPGGTVYSATKAFGLNFAESLWAELAPQGIDVICAVCGAMDTPSLNTLLDRHNLKVPNLWDPGEVTETILARLGETPLHVFITKGEETASQKIEAVRRQRLSDMEQIAKAFYGDVSG